MCTKYFKFFVMISVCISLVSIPQVQAQAPEGLEAVFSIEQVNFELESLLGKKVWVLGYYGDGQFTGDGVGFLVIDFHLLIIDEELPHHSFIRLDGNLPPSGENGAEILVYGEVKDFGRTYNAYTVRPTPLITVEEYRIITPSDIGKPGIKERIRRFFKEKFSQGKIFFRAESAFAAGTSPKGTKAKPCDRALIISGGIDANNNHARYKDNLIAKYKKLKELGFTDEQIGTFYNDGAAVDVDGKNAVDGKASKQNIKDTLKKFKDQMQASCTLTIFVTDHGTGYNEGQGWHGARPAFEGEKGKTYSENTFKIDLRAKVYRENVWTNPGGDIWWVHINKKTNKLELYKKEGGKWVKKGSDTNGDGRITESETGQDIDGDGDKDDVGWTEAGLGAWKHRNNTWDTDGDGTDDVRARWDGSKFIFERFKDGAWKKMGEDTDGDFIIDGNDGGVDWKLD